MKAIKLTILTIIITGICNLYYSCNDDPVDLFEEEDLFDPGDTVTQTVWSYSTPFPFDQVSKEELRALPKKVFAHYFTQFPISIDNKDPGNDYYQTEYLSPFGENNKHVSYGGYLRVRPLPRPPRPESNWMEKDMEEEIRRAAALGIDGFTCDLLSHQGYHYDRVVMLMEAAARIDPGFKIVLMPDMEAFKNQTDKIEGMIKILGAYSAAYRLADNRLVVSPYNAQVMDAAWWKDWLDQMKSDGIDIAFVPLFQAWKTFAPTFAPISYGMSDWGWRSVSSQNSWINTAQEAQSYGPIWMMPVSPQDMRPKDQRIWEAKNSEEYRVMWENAINGGSDWVQLVTWNDYSEHTIVAPSTGTQYSFYDLSAYYISWFKKGSAPAITRDVLYYFYRGHENSIQAKKQEISFKFDSGSDSPSNQIELVAFLKAPGKLEIEIKGKKKQKDADAGITVFKVPMEPGRPVFRLIRNEKTVINLPGAFVIKDEIDYQNLMYYGGNNSRLPVIVETE